MKKTAIPREVAERILAEHRIRLASRVRELLETTLRELVARGSWGPAQEAEWTAAVETALDDTLADFRRLLAAATVPAGAGELDS